jgi:integrase
MFIRNKAILATLFNTFMRRHELANLTLNDIDLDRNYIRIWAKAKGNGKRDQYKKLTEALKPFLREWLEVRYLMADPECNALFVGEHGGRMTGDGIGCLFMRLSEAMEDTIYAHMFRGGGAIHGSHMGIPDRLLMKQGGWESYDVFMRYTENVKLDRFGDMWDGDDVEAD